MSSLLDLLDIQGFLATEEQLRAVENDRFYQMASEEEKKIIRSEIESIGTVTAGVFAFIEALVTSS